MPVSNDLPADCPAILTPGNPTTTALPTAKSSAATGIKDDSPLDCRNIAGWFKQAYRKNGIFVEKQSSGQIAKLLGLEDEIRALGLDEHNAFYDVHSILAGLRHLGFAETI